MEISEELSSFIRTPLLATYRVKGYQNVYTHTALARLIGIARPTLRARLKKNNWRITELEKIVKHFPELAEA